MFSVKESNGPTDSYAAISLLDRDSQSLKVSVNGRADGTLVKALW